MGRRPKKNNTDVKLRFATAVKLVSEGLSAKRACKMAKIDAKTYRKYRGEEDARDFTVLDLNLMEFERNGRPPLLSKVELDALDAILSLRMSLGKCISYPQFKHSFVRVRQHFWQLNHPDGDIPPNELSVEPTDKTVRKYANLLHIRLKTTEVSPTAKVRTETESQRYSMKKFFNLVERIFNNNEVISVYVPRS
jgi:hypothetical protein